MAREQVTQSPDFYTVSTAPDMCKVQAGSAIVIVPFMVKGEFKECENVSKDVFARGYPVVWKADSAIPNVTGDKGGNRYGVKSNTNEGEAKAKQGSSTVTANGKAIVRQGDMCTLNKGNTFGPVLYRGAPAVPSKGQAPRRPSASSPEGQCEFALNQAASSSGGLAPVPPGALQKRPGAPRGEAAKSLKGGQSKPRKPNIVKLPSPTAPGSGGNDGGVVTGKGAGAGRCELKPYRNQDGSKNCPNDQTPHHVIPDRAYRIGSRTNGERIPGAPSVAEGLCLCVSGRSLDPNLEHGRIHQFYDQREKRLGRIRTPKGTGKFGQLERLAAKSAAKETGCDPGHLKHQLEEFNRSRGIGKEDLGRADPGGKLTKGMDPKSLGRGSGTNTPGVTC